MPKNKYTIPCTWQVSGFITVEADNLAEALNEADDAPLPDTSDYIDGSFEINHDMISFYNDNLTKKEKNDCNIIHV